MGNDKRHSNKSIQLSTNILNTTYMSRVSLKSMISLL